MKTLTTAVYPSQIPGTFISTVLLAESPEDRAFIESLRKTLQAQFPRIMTDCILYIDESMERTISDSKKPDFIALTSGSDKFNNFCGITLRPH